MNGNMIAIKVWIVAMVVAAILFGLNWVINGNEEPKEGLISQMGKNNARVVKLLEEMP